MKKDTLYQNLDQYHLLNQGHLDQQDTGKSAAEWAAYAAAAGAALAMSSAADASIIYVNPTDIVLNINQPLLSSSNTSTFIDLNNDGTNDFQLLLNWDSNGASFSSATAFGSAYLNGVNGGRVAQVGSVSELAQLPLNTPIDVGLNFGQFGLIVGNFYSITSGGSTAANSSGVWVEDVQSFAGVRFNIGGNTHYGWIRLSWNDTHGIDTSMTPDGFVDQVTIYDWAYESTPDTTILAGATPPPTPPTVPEPGSLALLATGAAGIAALRRRRQQTH